MVSVFLYSAIVPHSEHRFKPAVRNPFTAPAETRRDMPGNGIFSGPITSQLSMLCVLIKVLSQSIAKKKTKKLEGLKVHTFIGRFQVTSRQ